MGSVQVKCGLWYQAERMHLRASPLLSLCALRFLIYKMGITSVSFSQGCCEA